MPPKKVAGGSTQDAESSKPRESKKRKWPPISSSNSQNDASTRRGFKRVKTSRPDARTISTQTSDSAVKNGELDVQSFLKAREFEIKALQNGMQKVKAGRNTRAFQQVPRDMRRRTASHNVKRVPKRLLQRATKEMKDDNTPTVTPNKRKPRSSRGRIRAETAKRLGILAAKKKYTKDKKSNGSKIDTRPARPKLRQDLLNEPPKPKAKFRKRQIHKTWLPTHLWHAKRAKMTEPKNPLWRFSIPITSTEKSYRPTHRAGGASGAVAWDMSYMSTIGLEGPQLSLEKLLKAVGVIGQGLWEERGLKWKDGKRSWSGWLTREVNSTTINIGPSTIIWCPPKVDVSAATDSSTKNKSSVRKLFLRVHPAAFLETWNELLRISKLQRPVVHVQDLRFEIGSINITGPGSTETLLGILHPYCPTDQDGHAETFQSLNGVTNAASLPPNSLLTFSIKDPRLNYPPRPVKPPDTSDGANLRLLEMLSTWPVDKSPGSSSLFDRDARFKATRLPSQKAINRRKSLAAPGSYPDLVATDPPIPIILLATRSGESSSMQGTWTLLTPWKCILPIWYGLMHFPLSSGKNPRFGGLQELRQIHFESEIPWFPADYPGTNAGFAWEADERLQRKAEWDRRPKGKRIEYDSLDLGAGRKGEIGRGWACDFEKIVDHSLVPGSVSSIDATSDIQAPSLKPSNNTQIPVHHIPRKTFTPLLSSSDPAAMNPPAVTTIRITLVGRGLATPCARIYRLPQAPSNLDSSTTNSSPSTTREQWLSLLPPPNSKPLPNPKSLKGKTLTRLPANAPLRQRVRLLAASLLQDPPMQYPAERNDDNHPLVPDEEDLIGFVTTGEFNLAEGKSVAIGTVVVSKILEGMTRDGKNHPKERVCIVRNSGEKIGRLARWEAV